MDSETARRSFEVSSIMRHNRIGLSIHRCFENHFIVGIRQLWPPAEVDLDWVDELCEVLKQSVYDSFRKAMFCSPQNLLILEK